MSLAEEYPVLILCNELTQEEDYEDAGVKACSQNSHFNECDGVGMGQGGITGNGSMEVVNAISPYDPALELNGRGDGL